MAEKRNTATQWKSRELRLVDGDKSGRKLPPEDPSTDPVGDPTVRLLAEEQSIWEELVFEIPWAKRADRKLIELLSSALLTHHAANRRLRTYVDSDDMENAVRAGRIVRNSQTTLLQCFAELGATPRARARLLAPTENRDPTEEERAKRLFGG